MKIKKPIKRDEIPVLNIGYMVSTHFEVSTSQLKADTRKREFVLPRQVMMYLLYKYTNMTLKEVGREFNKDHSTVMHANQTISDLMDVDKSFKAKIQLMEDTLIRSHVAKMEIKKERSMCFHIPYQVQILRTIGK